MNVAAALLILMASLIGVCRSFRWGAGNRAKAPSTSLSRFLCAAIDDNVNTSPASIKPPESWNLKGLKAETSRNYLRAFKKVGKLSERRDKAQKLYDEIMSKESMTDEDFERIPNPEAIMVEINDMRARLDRLNVLELGLKEIRTNADPKFKDMVTLAIELGVGDTAPARAPVGPKKPKGKPQPPRKPYWVYISQDKIPIRVGRSSADNDILSCNPDFRDSRNWWLHTAGSAGSHVVIRSTDDNLPSKHYETLYDAALLAASKSKGGGGRVPVHYVRCRQVSKPKGAKDGLVYLNGDIGSITVDMKASAKRLEKLIETKTTRPEDDPPDGE
jgi:predicted ribosome quality control (RQC) complex YloA/Tae2 family protein